MQEETQEILVLGMTYPTMSDDYMEVVCTGGLLRSTRRMIRLHPISYRQLEGEHKFKAWQWISAKIHRDESDKRPESYRINEDSIELGHKIAPRDHSDRRAFLEGSPHFVESVEDLNERREKSPDPPSLAVIKVTDIIDFSIVPKPKDKRVRWERRASRLFSQPDFEGILRKPPEFVPFYFMVSWRCEDSRCRGHKLSILDWGLHELYKELIRKGDEDWNQKVRDAMKKRLNSDGRDVFIFLGNARRYPKSFMVMSALSVRRDQHPQLFPSA